MNERLVRLDAEIAVFCVVLLVDFFAELRRRAQSRRTAMRSGAGEQRDERLPVNPEVGHPIPVAKIKRAEIVRLTLRGVAGVAVHPGEPRELRDRICRLRQARYEQIRREIVTGRSPILRAVALR